MTMPNKTERREFVRLDYIAPLAYKVCKAETLSKLFQGYTVNISENGILCKIKEPVNIGDVLWLSFDRGVLAICEELESKSFIYQNGVIGKVMRIETPTDSEYTVGVKFLTRQEQMSETIRSQI